VMVKLGPVTPIGLTRLVAMQRKVDGLSVVPQQLARLSHAVPLGATDAYVAPHWHASTRQPSESPQSRQRTWRDSFISHADRTGVTL
jgi:hypothetical protein